MSFFLAFILLHFLPSLEARLRYNDIWGNIILFVYTNFRITLAFLLGSPAAGQNRVLASDG